MCFLYSARAASRASLATVMMVCLFSAASAEEAYICIPTASGGVRFDEATKRWLGTSLKTNDEKYIVRQPKVVEKNTPQMPSGLFLVISSPKSNTFGPCARETSIRMVF